MTSLREVIARIIGKEISESDLPDPSFDFRVYWTKQAMGWKPERRERVHMQVRLLLDRPDFKPGELQRLYHLEALDDQDFSGVSMVELEAVLRTMQSVNNEWEIR